MFVEAHPLVTM